MKFRLRDTGLLIPSLASFDLDRSADNVQTPFRRQIVSHTAFWFSPHCRETINNPEPHTSAPSAPKKKGPDWVPCNISVPNTIIIEPSIFKRSNKLFRHARDVLGTNIESVWQETHGVGGLIIHPKDGFRIDPKQLQKTLRRKGCDVYAVCQRPSEGSYIDTTPSSPVHHQVETDVRAVSTSTKQTSAKSMRVDVCNRAESARATS